MSFVGSSLHKASTILTAEQHQLTKHYFRQSFDLMKEKLDFPYSKLDSHESAVSLPAVLAKEDYYNQLSQSNITDDEYSKLQQVASHFKLVTLQDMMMIYMDLDCLMLADICSCIRQMMRDNFQIEPFHYLTLGSLSYDLLLKCSQVRVELIHSDPTPYLFAEQAIVGGLSFVNGRYLESNNSLCQNFDPTKTVQSAYLLDINSMYSTCMLRNPYYIGEARFLSKQEIASFTLDMIEEQGEIGYLIESDLHCPQSTHDMLSLFPPLPTRKRVKYTDLSPYTQQLITSQKLPFSSKGTVRLVADLEDKKHYTCTGPLLKFCVERLGLELRGIHRILEYRQQAWLSSHVQKLMEMRAAATSKLMNQMCKLLSNILYGTLSSAASEKEREMKNVHQQQKHVTR
jgi:hypothetical protein